MPGTQFPNHHYHPVNNGRSNFLELPQQSADRGVSPRRPRSPGPALPLSPQPGQRRTKKRAKNVRWDSSVVDNEQEMQSRPKKPAADMHPSRSHVASAKPSMHPSLSKSPTANTSAKTNPSHSRQPSENNSVQNHRRLSTVSARNSRSQAHHSTHTGANSSSKRVLSPKRNSPIKIRKNPPAAPDPPKAHRPPPAPRPARLPTPDLPEIDEAKFFVPKDKLFDVSRGRSEKRGRMVQQKTGNQLDTAVAYI